MIDAFAGKLYKWSGNTFVWSATGQTRYITKGTGDTVEDNGTTAPVDASAADWIVSDDLYEIGAKTASLRIKVTKAATASAYTAGTHYCNGFGARDSAELAATKSISNGTSSIYISASGTAASNGSISIPTYLTAGATVGAVTYAHCHFYSSPAAVEVIPIRFAAVVLVMTSHASNSPANHEWTFELQWYYTR